MELVIEIFLTSLKDRLEACQNTTHAFILMLATYGLKTTTGLHPHQWPTFELRTYTLLDVFLCDLNAWLCKDGEYTGSLPKCHFSSNGPKDQGQQGQESEPL